MGKTVDSKPRVATLALNTAIFGEPSLTLSTTYFECRPRTIFGTTDVRGRIERGDILARKALAIVGRTVDLPLDAIASLIGTSTRTINRHLANNDRLSPSEADRMFRLARVVDPAAEMVGDSTRPCVGFIPLRATSETVHHSKCSARK